MSLSGYILTVEVKNYLCQAIYGQQRWGSVPVRLYTDSRGWMLSVRLYTDSRGWVLSLSGYMLTVEVGCCLCQAIF